MILVDANLLIYAVNADSPHHLAARAWLEETLSGTTHVGLAWTVMLAFLRITTRKRIFERPLEVGEAVAYLDSWLDQPFVSVAETGPRHWSILRRLIVEGGTAGDLTSDAHLAALAIERGCPVYSSDRDFARFPGVEHLNPLASRS